MIDVYGGGGNDTLFGYGNVHGGSGNDRVEAWASSVWGDSGYDDFYLYAFDWNSKVIVKDFVVGVDDLIIDIHATVGTLIEPISGDTYTVQYTDFWGDPHSYSFELDGVTNINMRSLPRPPSSVSLAARPRRMSFPPRPSSESA